MAKLWQNLWFRCTIILLLIAVASGALLSIANSVFAVSEAERTRRAIVKIYNEEKPFSVELDVDSTDTSINSTPYSFEDYGVINKVYIVDKDDEFDTEYDRLFSAIGTKGFNGGTISLWVRVAYSQNSSPTINKIIVSANTKQTLMSKIDNSFISGFYIDITDKYFSANKDGSSSNTITNIVTGATYSATAVVNAVNTVINYIREV